MNSSRAPGLGSSHQLQHIEYLEELTDMYSSSLRTRHNGVFEDPTNPYLRVALQASHRAIHIRDFTYRSISVSRDTLPPPTYSRRHVRTSFRPACPICLAGFWYEPGDREYEEAARARGVKDGSQIYWFSKIGFANNSTELVELEYEEDLGMNDC
jgi:hypothetical protein